MAINHPEWEPLQDLRNLELYAPHHTPHEELRPLQTSLVGEPQTTFDRIGPSWVALLKALARLEQQTYRPRVGRTVFQKLAYFASELGFDLDLEYSRGSYGPFAAKIKPCISHLMNNGLITESRQGNMLEIRIGPTFEAAERAFASTLPTYEGEINRLVDLFSRVNTSAAEVAATVHYAWRELLASKGSDPMELEVVNAVMEWKQRRRPPLTRKAVAEATRGLNLLGWIKARPSEGVGADPTLELLGA